MSLINNQLTFHSATAQAAQEIEEVFLQANDLKQKCHDVVTIAISKLAEGKNGKNKEINKEIKRLEKIQSTLKSNLTDVDKIMKMAIQVSTHINIDKQKQMIDSNAFKENALLRKQVDGLNKSFIEMDKKITAASKNVNVAIQKRGDIKIKKLDTKHSTFKEVLKSVESIKKIDSDDYKLVHKTNKDIFQYENYLIKLIESTNKKIENLENKEVDTKNLRLFEQELLETLADLGNLKTRVMDLEIKNIRNINSKINRFLKLTRKKSSKFFNIFQLKQIEKAAKKIPFSKNKGATYFFAQQFNNSCHLSPFVNLERLEKLRTSHYDLTKMEAYTKRQWLGEDQAMLTSWNKALSVLSAKGADQKYPNLHEFITSGITEGPVMPNFYDKKGKSAFSGVKGFVEFTDMPIFLINIDQLEKTHFHLFGGAIKINLGDEVSSEDLGLKTGVIKEKGQYKVYNVETKNFDPIETIPGLTIEKTAQGTIVNIDPHIDPSLKKRYQLHDQYQIKMNKNEGLGFEEIGQIDELAAGFEHLGHKYYPYLTSLLKLMLLSAGVGSDNRVIDENHPERPLWDEFNQIMTEHPNIWTGLDKDKIIQYHMAEILKEDPYLKAAMEQTCDLYCDVFKSYKSLKQGNFYRDQAQSPIKTTVKLKGQDLEVLPGEEQMIAYAFNLRLRWLWYGMQNPQVLCKCNGFPSPKIFAKFLNFGLRRLAYKRHKVDFSKVQSTLDSSVKYQKKLSYVEVWGMMRERLMERMETLSRQAGTDKPRLDFVSFDDHGWVMSFDPAILKLQNEKLSKGNKAVKNTIFDDVKVARDFGFAGIESWWGTEMPTFYKAL